MSNEELGKYEVIIYIILVEVWLLSFLKKSTAKPEHCKSIFILYLNIQLPTQINILLIPSV